jgi:ribonuclease HI
MDKIQVIYDLFCDASVGPELRGTCSGVLINRRPLRLNGKELEFSGIQRTFMYCIQMNGTNNSGEVAAVAMAVRGAIDIYSQIDKDSFNATFNVFSDSLITINGVREWLPNWIKKADRAGNLMTASGKQASNQEFFKFIYNTILESDININFFHQDGHITTNVDRMIPDFVKFNYGLKPSDLGLTPMQLCACNDFVDRETRMLINQYLSSGVEDEHCRMSECYKNTYITNKKATDIYLSKIAVQFPSP